MKCRECNEELELGHLHFPNCGERQKSNLEIALENVDNNKYRQSKNNIFNKPKFINESRNNTRIPHAPELIIENNKHKQYAYILHKKYIVILISLFVLVCILLAFGNFYYSKTNQINRLINTLNTQDTNSLSSLIKVEEVNIKLDDKTLKPLFNYYNDNKDEINEVLKNDVITSQESKYADQNINLIKEGKYFHLFDKYLLQLNPVYATLLTNQKNPHVKINDQEIKNFKIDKNNLGLYSVRVGPLLPGKYQFKVQDQENNMQLIANNRIEILYDNEEVLLKVNDN